MSKHKKKTYQPPRWADKLLQRFCSPELVEEILGDLHERYALRAQKVGEQKAKKQYVREVMAYIRLSNFKLSSEGKNIILMGILNNYIKVAGRNLLRHKAFSFINITGLSIGLACCMLIVLYTKDEVSFDQFHEKKDQIYRVTAMMTRDDGIKKLGGTNQIVGPSFAAEVPEIASYTRMETTTKILRNGTDNYNEEVLAVEDNFFSVFSFPLVAGSSNQVFSELNTMVLSENAAKKYFGTTDVVGKTLDLNFEDQFESFVITGVAKNPPQNSSIQFNVLIPFKFGRPSDEESNWVGFHLNTFVVLNETASWMDVEPKFDQVFQSKAAEELKLMRERFAFIKAVNFKLQPLSQIHLDAEYGALRNGLTSGSDPIYSYILSGIALFILLIASINFINLTVAHSLRRAKEIGIRKVIGGQRVQLVIQFLGESFVLCLLAFCAAILIVQLVLPTFNELANKQLSFTYLLDIKLISGYVILFLATGLIAGFYPALVLSGFEPVKILYNRFQPNGKNYLVKGLVVFQFALATFLIIGTVGIYAQFNLLTNKDLGYNDENLAIVHLGNGDYELELNSMKNDLAKDVSIENIAVKYFGQSGTIGKINNNETDIKFDISWIDEAFLPMAEIPLVEGRNFSTDFPNDKTQSVIINETFAKEAGWDALSQKNPIGQVINYRDEQLTVVGVIKDYHFRSLRESIRPLLFKNGSGDLWIKLKADQIPLGLDAVQKAYEKVFPFRPFHYDFMSTINERRYVVEAKWKEMITAGALLSIFISSMGLFGLAMLTIQRRTKEVGIRKVLGAKVTDIVTLISVDFVRLVIIAFVIAIPAGAYAINYWLQDFAYRIELSWWIFALPGFVALSIAIITISFQSVKAAIANPIDSLRNE